MSNIMKRRKKHSSFYLKIFLAGILLFGLTKISDSQVRAAQTDLTNVKQEISDLDQGKQLFSQGRNMVYNSEASLQEIIAILNNSKDVFTKLPDGFDKYYWLAQVEFIIAEAAENSGDKTQAADRFTESNNFIRKALSFKPKSSDANRLLGDTIMRLTDYKGGFYMISQGPQAFKLFNHAIKLDPKNYTAMNSLSVYYLYAPAIGGGSVDKAIEFLQKALESKDVFDNFISNVWLGKAFQMKKNKSKAMEFYNKAILIYPNSSLVKGFLKELDLI